MQKTRDMSWNEPWLFALGLGLPLVLDYELRLSIGSFEKLYNGMRMCSGRWQVFKIALRFLRNLVSGGASCLISTSPTKMPLRPLRLSLNSFQLKSSDLQNDFSFKQSWFEKKAGKSGGHGWVVQLTAFQSKVDIFLHN